MATTTEVGYVMSWLLKQPLLKKPETDWEIESQRNFLIQEYLLPLIDVEVSILRVAAETWVNTEKWFPTPSDLRNIAIDLIFNMMALPNSTVAWKEVRQLRSSQWGYPRHMRRTPRFSNGVISTVVEWIGWYEILNTPEDELKWVAQEFKKLYDGEVDNIKELARMPEGARVMVLEGRRRRGLSPHTLLSGYLLSGDTDE